MSLKGKIACCLMHKVQQIFVLAALRVDVLHPIWLPRFRETFRLRKKAHDAERMSFFLFSPLSSHPESITLPRKPLIKL